MAIVRLLRPLDQPAGNRRLLSDLSACLSDVRFTRLRVIVAYAKSGPFLRLRAKFEQWRSSGKVTEAVIGIDQRGTSHEALGLALQLFDAVYVTQESGITFHPKMYWFEGQSLSRAYVGSNNLTVGGTETNFESGVQLELDPIQDAAIHRELDSAWGELLPGACLATRKLDGPLLAQLFADGYVIEERAMRDAGGSAHNGKSFRGGPRSGMVKLPPSALPRPVSNGSRRIARRSQARGAQQTPGPLPSQSAGGFAIQIKPHHNGEIFLSVAAAREYPAFFRWPFTGATTPKKPGNPSYPQLLPDPIVNIEVYGATAPPIFTLAAYNLNTIYYERKSEIRITAAPLVGIVPDYSVMIMQTSNTVGIDYDITVHTPASPDYASWVSACDRLMPGGGKTPRRYGWF